MGLVFGDSRICWRCKGKGKTERGTCAVCGGGGVLGAGETQLTLDEPQAARESNAAAGRAERDRILPLVAEGSPTWMEAALSWIEARAVDTEFTADDLTLTIGHPAKRQAVGAAFSMASRRKLVERAGLQQSAIPTSHASVIQVWRRI
jgi:hypothetical protein